MKKIYGKYYVKIPQEDIEQAMIDLSPKAFQLLTYYFSKNDGFIFSNDIMADLMSISKRQLSTYHRELKQKGYLAIQKGDVTVYFIGKTAVREYNDDGKVQKAAIVGDGKVQMVDEVTGEVSYEEPRKLKF